MNTMAEIIKLGCLQLNGNPVPLGVKYNGESISFGDTFPEKAISFVKWKNLLVADRCVCTNISWEDLHQVGFIFGQLIKIDEKPYLCRSLKVGKDEDIPNEWDAILDDLGEDDSLWHWNMRYFWGQEIPEGFVSDRAARGLASARYWVNYTATDHHAHFGFRPVLEPLLPHSLITDSVAGANLRIYGPDGTICGRLVSFCDYELIVCPPFQQVLHDGCQWACVTEDGIVVDRSAVAWKKEEV